MTYKQIKKLAFGEHKVKINDCNFILRIQGNGACFLIKEYGIDHDFTADYCKIDQDLSGIPEDIETAPDWCPLKQSDITIKLNTDG